MFQFARGITFGVDIGNFLQLQRALQGDRVIETPADKKKIPAIVVSFHQRLDLLLDAR